MLRSCDRVAKLKGSCTWDSCLASTSERRSFDLAGSPAPHPPLQVTDMMVLRHEQGSLLRFQLAAVYAYHGHVSGQNQCGLFQPSIRNATHDWVLVDRNRISTSGMSDEQMSRGWGLAFYRLVGAPTVTHEGLSAGAAHPPRTFEPMPFAEVRRQRVAYYYCADAEPWLELSDVSNDFICSKT